MHCQRTRTQAKTNNQDHNQYQYFGVVAYIRTYHLLEMGKAEDRVIDFGRFGGDVGHGNYCTVVDFYCNGGWGREIRKDIDRGACF